MSLSVSDISTMKTIGMRNSAASPCMSRTSASSSFLMSAKSMVCSVAQGAVGERHEELFEIVAAEFRMTHFDAFGFQRLQHGAGAGALAQMHAPVHTALLHGAKAREHGLVEAIGCQCQQHCAL